MRVRFLAAAVGILGVLATPAAALAQVGHPPRSSPYRDIRKGHTLTALGGYFGGDGGQFGIGPHNGNVFGGRYDIRTGSTIQLGLGIAHGTVERFILDPFVTVDNRRSGPVKQSVTYAEIDLQFNVTGGKSWNRLAPYASAGAGLAFAGNTPADTSRYDFGRGFYFAPALGTRVFLSDRLHLRAEARLTFWKLNYPTTFQRQPPDAGSPVIAGNNLSEWTTSPWLQVGVGYAFPP